MPVRLRRLATFRYARDIVLYHELALLVAAAIAVTLPAMAQPGRHWTFLVLWAMRQSAKLNVFLGVRNLSEEFLPEHLRYLESFFTRKPMNLLFPVSITVSTVVAVLMWSRALGRYQRIRGYRFTFASTLLTLAMLEHWFLVLPLPANALWRWGLRSHQSKS